MPRTHDDAYNRDEDQKPREGASPRAASEPEGSEGSARSAKTFTDPASGAGQKPGHSPNQAETDLTEGAPHRHKP